MAGNRSSTAKPLIAAAVIIPLIVLNWRVVERRQMQDRLNEDLVNQKMPPTLALTTQAIGPFRGLITNGLWWRAVRLQDEGNHFEAIQLADWISSLQPKLSFVWTWQAWNMAYNIAAAYEEPEEKWKWTLEGLNLLRHKGVKYNPREAFISLDIARIFKERIGGSRYNKLQLARTMMRYMPNGDVHEIKALKKAAATEEELRRRKGVAAHLKQADAVGLDLLDPELTKKTVCAELPDDQRKLLAGPAWDEVLAHLRRRGIEEEMAMDLDQMLLIDQKYGPLDWRLYQAHVIYWGASESYDAVHGRENYQFPYHRQALVDAFYDGQLLYADDKGLTTGPNLQVAAKVHHYVVEHAELFQSDRSAYSMSRDFHEWAILILYSNMYIHEAEKMFEDFREHLMTDEERRKWTFETFLVDRAGVMLTRGRTSEHRALVFSSLMQAYYWAAMGDPYRAKGYENMARLVWKRNQKMYPDNPDNRLPPFNKLRQTACSQASGPFSPFPKEVKTRINELRGDTNLIQLEAPVGKRPEVEIGDHAHEPKPAKRNGHEDEHHH